MAPLALTVVRGDVAEWLRSGLQSRLHRFDSGRRLTGEWLRRRDSLDWLPHQHLIRDQLPDSIVAALRGALAAAAETDREARLDRVYTRPRARL
jgi:hypothetical protein